RQISSSRPERPHECGHYEPPAHGSPPMGVLFSLLYWCYFAVSSGVLFLGALAIWATTAPFDPTRSLLHRYTCWWATLYLRCLPGCRIDAQGREKIAPRTPYVLV